MSLKNIINLCLNKYKLDPLHFFSAPRVTWEAFLKHSTAKIPLFSYEHIYNLIEKEIIGGVSQCIKRFAKANNKYRKNFNETQSSNYLMYLDANNLYGWESHKIYLKKTLTY